MTAKANTGDHIGEPCSKAKRFADAFAEAAAEAVAFL